MLQWKFFLIKLPAGIASEKPLENALSVKFYREIEVVELTMAGYDNSHRNAPSKVRRIFPERLKITLPESL